MSFSTDFNPSLDQQLMSSASLENNINNSNGTKSKEKSIDNRLNLHSKASSVSFLDFGSSGSQFSRNSKLPLNTTITPQTVTTNSSTAMALLSPPSSRYTFENTSNPSFFNPNSKSNYTNLGNDWSLNLNFSLSKQNSDSNLEEKTTEKAEKSESEERSDLESSVNFSNAVTFDENIKSMKKWLDNSILDDKHNFIDELLDYFLFTPDHSTDLINYLKVKIDRLSFNDDLDSPTTATAQTPISAVPQHSHNQSVNGLDSVLLSTPIDSSFISKNYHSKSNSVHVPLSDPQNQNVSMKQTINAPPKDQHQVFSPLLAESGFLQNQAMRYANGSRHNAHSRQHSKSASISNMSINTNVNNSGMNNGNSNGEILTPSLMSPINTSLGRNRGPNNLSINTSLSVNNNGPQSATGQGPSGLQSAAGPVGSSAITSPTSPMTPGGYNLDGLDPSTRLKLQALSTINSRSKLDALKKTAYNDGVPKSPGGPNSGPSQGQQLKSYKSNSNLKAGTQNRNSIGATSNVSNKKPGTLTPKKMGEIDDKSCTPTNNLAQALKSLQIASNESTAILNNSGIYSNNSFESNLGTPVKQATLSLLSPKSPGLNSLELIDLKNLNDLPVWLKNLRLHKYTKILEGYKWEKLIYLSDEELENIGVTALGARRKLLKAFDIVKVAYENDDIIGLEKK